MLRAMDWQRIVLDILARGYVLREIAEECGFASPGAVHDLKSGAQTTCQYERGAKLLLMHKRALKQPAAA